MPIHFEDRQAKYPNRWTMKKSDGTSEVVTLIRNDEPTVEGTPMNAETLNQLSDVAGADVARAEAEAAAQNAKDYSDEAKNAAENAAQEAASRVVDPTLTLSGKAADAKATGAAVDKLEDKKADKTALDTERKRIDVLNEGGLNLKDEVIDTSIRAWLTEHPEATTTVQDGAITEPKINAEFLNYIKKDYVTPEMFGAVGDGVTDDISSVKKMFEYAKQKNKLVFLPNLYAISDPVTINYNASIIGAIYNYSGFKQLNSSKDVMQIARNAYEDLKGLNIKNLMLLWNETAEENTCGIRIKQVATLSHPDLDGWGMHECCFENILIRNPYVGIVNEKNEPSWNIKYRNIRINSAQYQVAEINANFGIELDLTAIGESQSEVKRGIALIPNFTGTLNYDIEDWDNTVLYTGNSYAKLQIDHVHMERCSVSGNYKYFISIINQYVKIGEITLYNVSVNSDTYASLVLYSVSSSKNSNLIIEHIFDQNTILKSQSTRFYAIKVVKLKSEEAEFISVVCASMNGISALYEPSSGTPQNLYYKYNLVSQLKDIAT